MSIDLGNGFRAVPFHCVNELGCPLEDGVTPLNYDGPWALIGANGRALDGCWDRPIEYETLGACRNEVQCIVRAGEYSTCGGYELKVGDTVDANVTEPQPPSVNGSVCDERYRTRITLFLAAMKELTSIGSIKELAGDVCYVERMLFDGVDQG